MLVTGATGYMADQLLPALRERYRLRLVDIKPGKEDGVQIADLSTTDRSELDGLFDGVDTVLHLGYRHSAPGSNYDNTVPHIDKFEIEFGNIRMSQNVYRCAHDAGVRRVVVASSNHAADWYEHALVHKGLKDVVTPDELPLADNFYGWSKACYEHLGFVYATGALGRSLEVVQVRIGAPRDIDASTYSADEPPAPQPGPDYPTGLARYKRDLGAWLSARDAQQLFLRCVETEDIRNEHGIPWQVVYGISDNSRAFWSLTSARKVFGYQPQDDSEVAYAEDIRQLLTGTSPAGPGRVGA
ncbi:NAD-dependent epimerase/dehydratase family protein [Streptomyces sp. NPDC000880]